MTADRANRGDGPLSDIDGQTAREIVQQPDLWLEVLQNVTGSASDLDTFLRPLLKRPDLRILLSGAGTSAFAGQVLAPVLSRELGRHVEAVATTDLVSSPQDHFIPDDPTLLVSFARSGDSPESVAATLLAGHYLSEVYHLIVTCNADGHLAREHGDADGSFVILTPARSNDQGFAMTSSFTSMILAVLLAFGGKQAERAVEPISRAGRHVLAHHESQARELAQRGYERIVYLGSGALTGLARESALKVLELTAGDITAFGESSMGFRHGPKAILNERTLAVVYVSNDAESRPYDLDILAELVQALGGRNVLAILAETQGLDTAAMAWSLPGVAGLNDAAQALPAVLCAQLIALHASLATGHVLDNPFPSGEVNRVVQGVTLHLPDGVGHH